MKKLIYLLIAFWVTGIAVFPSTRKAGHSAYDLNNGPFKYVAPFYNPSQSIGGDVSLLNGLGSKCKETGALNKATGYFNQGWSFEDETNQERSLKDRTHRLIRGDTLRRTVKLLNCAESCRK